MENSVNISERTKRLSTRKGTRKFTQLKKSNQENMVKKNVPNKGDKRSLSQISPGKSTTSRKRTAFGDITNAIQSHSERIALGRKKSLKSQNKPPVISLAKTRSRRSVTNLSKTSSPENKVEVTDHVLEDVLCTELISCAKKTESVSSIFETSASDTSMASELNKSKSRPVPTLPASFLASENEQPIDENMKRDAVATPGLKPFDIDIDPNVVSEYAESVFINMKRRERKFKVKNYPTQSNAQTTGPMRAILVDWLVEVQENFELYHETLYLAVKLTDNYLQSNSTPKELLQLIGATSLLIACKIEERHPPPLDDFQFICDDAYTHKQFVQMELKILKALDFDINIPISYRFLRRFARVTSMSMQVLTLSRYILELSLHEAQFVSSCTSKIAAACLCLALKMRDECEWDVNFSYHTGYSEEELTDLIIALNAMVSEASKSKLQTVRTKYSHPIFYEVAKIPAVDPLLL